MSAGDFLHHPDGSHRTTAPTAGGRDLERFERDLPAHLADGHRHERDRDPYVTDYPPTPWGRADACRRSAQIDREEAHTLAADDPRQVTPAESAAAWERQAARRLGPDKRYVGSRAGDYGTAITVQVVGDADGGEYPLPYLDAHELERRLLGTTIPQADTPEGRSHEWGYEGSGPRDTAASLLADYCGEPQPPSVIQRFKRDVVAGLGRGRFTLPGPQVAAWLVANAPMVEQARAWMLTEARLLSGQVHPDHVDEGAP